MLKKQLAVAIALLLIPLASAYVEILSPIDAKLSGGENIFIGSAQPSETFELIFSRESELPKVLWDSLVIEMPGNEWAYSIEKQEKSFIVRIGVPLSAKENIYNLPFTLSNSQGLLSDFEANMKVGIKEGLMEFRVKKLQEKIVVGKESLFAIELENKSIASHPVAVTTGLSKAWFLPITVNMERGSTNKIMAAIKPRVVGKKDFTFTIESLISGKSLGEYKAEIEAIPSLPEKFSSTAYGMPFLDFALLPSRLASSLAALFSF